MEMGNPLNDLKEVIDHDEKSIEVHPINGCDRSRWENGIDCINSLLRPGSETLATMSDEQRFGLKNLKAMIMLSGDGLESAKNHIPQALLESSESSSSDFLLSEYAGYDRRSQIRCLAGSVSRLMSAQKCAVKIKSLASSNLRHRNSEENVRSQLIGFGSKDQTNIPAYWFDLDKESKLKVRELLSWDNISRWDFNIFDVDDALKGENTLVFVAWAIIGAPQSQHAMEMACLPFSDDSNPKVEGLAGREGYDFISELNVREKTLINFLHEIEKLYKDAFYHNQVHAADVTQSLHALLQMGGKKYSNGKLEMFSILIAAVIHDVGHPGLSNPFLINSKSDLALAYNDVSVLENMHLSTMFRLVMGNNRDRQKDIFENFLEEDLEASRKLIIKAVLTTDMTKHFSKLNNIKGIILSEEEGDNTAQNLALPLDRCYMSEILSFALHAADISNQSRDTATAAKWTDKLLDEFFHQGDTEQRMGLPITPLCDRNSTNREKSQITFINFIVLPTFELLGQLIPGVTTEVIPKINQNLKYWQEQDRLKTGAKDESTETPNS